MSFIQVSLRLKYCFILDSCFTWIVSRFFHSTYIYIYIYTHRRISVLYEKKNFNFTFIYKNVSNLESTFHEIDLRAIRYTSLWTTHMTYSEIKKKSRYVSYNNFSLLCLLSLSFLDIFFCLQKRKSFFCWLI